MSSGSSLPPATIRVVMEPTCHLKLVKARTASRYDTWVIKQMWKDHWSEKIEWRNLPLDHEDFA